MGKKFDLQKHDLIPHHTRISAKEAETFLKKYNISPLQIPKILSDDPIAKQIGAKKGEIIKIERRTKIGKYNYYRVVVEHA